MTTSLKLHYQGDPVLQRVADPVKGIEDPQFQIFLDDLIDACFLYDGVGIAAPQVGTSLQVFIMASQPNSRYPDAPAMEPEAVINPKILFQSEEQEYSWEGCLSVPGMRGKVPRPVRIEVEYINRHGAPIRKTLENFEARLFLHEYDHLIGTLYPERMAPEDPLLSQEEYLALVQKGREGAGKLEEGSENGHS